MDDLATTDAGDLASPPDLRPALTATLVGAKANGPANANLTAEGASDWIHLGLASASDVNRKTSGGSRTTVTANGSIAQYNGHTASISWRDADERGQRYDVAP